jgi:hypothetical protein
MPFKEPFDTYYSAIIKPAITSLRLEAKRGDSLFRPSPIMGDIWEMIQNAKVLLAELTEKNANVFYELGLAHAIGKPVVLLSETIDDVPFDLQPLRVILYDKDDPAWGGRLRAALAASLSETLSDPTNAVPPMFRKKVKSQAPEENEALSRLSALERDVASLRSGVARGIQEPWRLRNIQLDQLKFRIQRASDVRSAAIAAKSALRQGVNSNMVRQTIMRYMPAAVAAQVIKEVFGTTQAMLDDTSLA